MADDAGRRGAILILTLWVIALLSLMAGGVMLRARLGLREAEWSDTEMEGRHLLRAATALALDRLAEDEKLDVDSYSEAWGRAYTADSASLLASHAGGDEFELEIRAVDETGKVNINVADEDLLVSVLREYGAGERAADIAKAIVDWRDEDDIGPFERDVYQRLEPAYGPSDADFESVDELLFVNRVDAALFFGEDANRNGLLDAKEDDGDGHWPRDNMDGRLEGGLVEAFTVYGDGSININTAPAGVVHAVLRIEFALYAGADSWADALLDRRQGRDKIDGTDDDAPFESEEEVAMFLAGLVGEENASQALGAAARFCVTSDHFRFYAWARYPERPYALAAEIVVKREDGQLTMLEYHDGE